MTENTIIKEFFNTLFEPEEMDILEILENTKEDDDIVNIAIDKVGEKE